MKRLIAVLAFLVISLSIGIRAIQPLVQDESLTTVSFLNVGQGDAIYIRAPNGNDVLIDGGPDDRVTRELRSVMPAFDTSLSLVIATHPDKDHIAGLIPVFERMNVRAFIHSEKASGTSFEKSLSERIELERGLKTIIARRGQRIILDERSGVYLDILFPDQDTHAFKETNEASVVTRLTHGSVSFMLTGDAYADVEEFLVEHDGTRLRSDVLKLGHHGSKTSTSEQFLATVQPAYAIVSAGAKNSYGHPADEVMKRITKLGIKTVSTIDKGTVTFRADGTRLILLET